MVVQSLQSICGRESGRAVIAASVCVFTTSMLNEAARCSGGASTKVST
jgi:hypothetical protein